MAHEQQTNWKISLAALQAELAEKDTRDQVEMARAAVWSEMLHDIFNSKCQGGMLAGWNKKSRTELTQVARMAFALVGQIQERLLKNELSATEVNKIYADARDIQSSDPLMYGIQQSLAVITDKAWLAMAEKHNAEEEAWHATIAQKENAVFRDYLAQNLEAVDVLHAIMWAPGRNSIPGLKAISDTVGRTVTKDELQSLADEISPILGNIHNIRPFTVIKAVKPEFRAAAQDQLTDAQHDYYFSMSGRPETRKALQDAYSARRTPSPPL